MRIKRQNQREQPEGSRVVEILMFDVHYGSIHPEKRRVEMPAQFTRFLNIWKFSERGLARRSRSRYTPPT
jgi:hypothetical protein